MAWSRPEILDPATAQYDVVMTDAGDRERDVVAAVCRLTSWHRSGARHEIHHLPWRVLRRASQTDARALADALRPFGATLELERYDP
jgi:hypothetical protein